MLKLSIVKGTDQGKVLSVGETPEIIGRHGAPGSGASILIQDHKVSRQHAQLARDADGWVLQDLDSSNGTYLNGVRLMGSVRVHDGDTIQVGETVLRVGDKPASKSVPASAADGGSGGAAAALPSGPLDEDEIVSMLVGPAEPGEEDSLELEGLDDLDDSVAGVSAAALNAGPERAGQAPPASSSPASPAAASPAAGASADRPSPGAASPGPGGPAGKKPADAYQPPSPQPRPMQPPPAAKPKSAASDPSKPSPFDLADEDED